VVSAVIVKAALLMVATTPNRRVKLADWRMTDMDFETDTGNFICNPRGAVNRTPANLSSEPLPPLLPEEVVALVTLEAAPDSADSTPASNETVNCFVGATSKSKAPRLTPGIDPADIGTSCSIQRRLLASTP
jgi:hypothetical protein